MLSEFAPKLRLKLNRLVQAGAPPVAGGEADAASFAALFPEYAALAADMVEGIEVWMLKIFSAKAKVRNYARNLDEDTSTIQKVLIQSFDSCLDPEVKTLLQFEYELRNTLHNFVRFNTVIKQNISYLLHHIPNLMHSRDLRAANFYITKSRTDFLKLLEKGDRLSAKQGGYQADEVAGMVMGAEKDKDQFLALLFSEKDEDGEDLKMLFSDEEQEILSRWLKDQDEE